MKARIDKLDELGVLVYDFLGGETMMHPEIAQLVRHVKSKRGGSNLATIITNGFLLTKKNILDLNEAGLDFMQVSVDTLHPTDWSDKSLKSVLPKLKLLAETAKFQVEIQSVLNEENLNNYDEFRNTLKELPLPSASPSCTAKADRSPSKAKNIWRFSTSTACSRASISTASTSRRCSPAISRARGSASAASSSCT
ncbi:MAG: hypothetical protein M0D55_09230 [Elusimicrobiota bacterium]|nr:MAG: hypothetical protein M0D55_09230 [Elusimicrobiota bacterium]